MQVSGIANGLGNGTVSPQEQPKTFFGRMSTGAIVRHLVEGVAELIKRVIEVVKCLLDDLCAYLFPVKPIQIEDERAEQIALFRQIGLPAEVIIGLVTAIEGLALANPMFDVVPDNNLFQRAAYPIPRTIQKESDDCQYVHLKKHDGVAALGKGGFGSVTKSVRIYKGHPELVAQKVQKEHMSIAKEEVAILKELQDIPYVIKMLNSMEYKGKGGVDKLSIVLEYCDGGRLSSRVIRRMSAAARWKLFLTILDTANTIHGRGYCHLDYKAENILLKTVDGKQEIRIADFGVARKIGKKVSKRGTPNYMPPELEQSKDGVRVEVTDKMDNYSLGMVGLKTFAFQPSITDINKVQNTHIRQALQGLLEPNPELRLGLPQAMALIRAGIADLH